jgi:hypothetical protein
VVDQAVLGRLVLGLQRPAWGWCGVCGD